MEGARGGMEGARGMNGCNKCAMRGGSGRGTEPGFVADIEAIHQDTAEGKHEGYGLETAAIRSLASQANRHGMLAWMGWGCWVRWSVLGYVGMEWGVLGWGVPGTMGYVVRVHMGYGGVCGYEWGGVCRARWGVLGCAGYDGVW